MAPNNMVNLDLIGEVAKDIDNIRLTLAHSSHAFTNLNHAIELNNEFNHLVSRKGTLGFSDPSTELYFNAIKAMNLKNSIGLRKLQVKDKTRLSAELPTMTTTIIHISGTSKKCKDRLILKTILVPVVDHRSRTVVVSENGRLYQNMETGLHTS